MNKMFYNTEMTFANKKICLFDCKITASEMHVAPHTATDWPKCFCLYRLKCSKAISGMYAKSMSGSMTYICCLISFGAR